jgi:hypothetical protein
MIPYIPLTFSPVATPYRPVTVSITVITYNLVNVYLVATQYSQVTVSLVVIPYSPVIVSRIAIPNSPVTVSLVVTPCRPITTSLDMIPCIVFKVKRYFQGTYLPPYLELIGNVSLYIHTWVCAFNRTDDRLLPHNTLLHARITFHRSEEHTSELQSR